MSDYQPIACMQHERLEFAVLRRLPLQIMLHDERALSGLALDVYTQGGAEWLKFRSVTGVEELIRLDHIASFNEV
jgi:Rho-binding antiterminator